MNDGRRIVGSIERGGLGPWGCRWQGGRRKGIAGTEPGVSKKQREGESSNGSNHAARESFLLSFSDCLGAPAKSNKTAIVTCI